MKITVYSKNLNRSFTVFSKKKTPRKAKKKKKEKKKEILEILLSLFHHGERSEEVKSKKKLFPDPNSGKALKI